MAAPRWSTLGEAVSHDLNQPIHNDRAGVLACLPVAPDFDQSYRSFQHRSIFESLYMADL